METATTTGGPPVNRCQRRAPAALNRATRFSRHCTDTAQLSTTRLAVAAERTAAAQEGILREIFGFLSFGWNTGVLVAQVEFCDNLPACDFDGFFGEQPSTTQPPLPGCSDFTCLPSCWFALPVRVHFAVPKT
ncbi:hypothetical protein MTO96_044878 [Rhipicephalus appendiculatus]